MSEVSQILPTQMSMGAISDASFKPGSESVDKPAKYKPRFAEFKCSHREVSLQHAAQSLNDLPITLRFPDLRLQ
jgi:hypothetical protein